MITQDYKSLRAEGIAHIQRLVGHRWTDHNVHDPGITILEQMCYALTDLSYRTGFSVPDLMAEGSRNVDWARPGQVLATSPITQNDLRKCFLDVPGVRNAWVSPADQDYIPRIYYDDTDRSLSVTLSEWRSEAESIPIVGLYNILLSVREGYSRKEVLKEVHHCFQAHRGLCEDLNRLVNLEDEEVQIGAELELAQASDPEALLARIYARIHQYLMPSIRFYTLSERLEAGYSIESLMEGPLLRHGFIDDEDLEGFKLRQYIRSSDLISLMMEDKEVKAVRQIRMKLATQPKPAQEIPRQLGEWSLKIPSGKAPTWHPQFADSISDPYRTFVLLQDGLPIRLRMDRVQYHFEKLIREQIPAVLPDSERDIPVATGRNRNVSQYQSIQMQFPDVYGIGVKGLPAGSSASRRAKAHQLKAYLSFLDQILANYFAQLGHASELFSSGWSEPLSRSSYRLGSLFSALPDFGDLLTDFQDTQVNQTEQTAAESEFELLMQEYTEAGSSDLDQAGALALQRRNRFLNHLLARFSEQLTDYGLKLFAESEQGPLEEAVRAKLRFLSEYPYWSARRGASFDYTKASWETDNVAGLKQRISRLLGMEALGCISLKDIPSNHSGGFHLVEHILFRPRSGDADQKSAFLRLDEPSGDTPPAKDPYSLQLSFIFPDWLDRFEDTKAQQVLLKTLREETPAHLRIRVSWLNKDDMAIFESNYQDWLIELQKLSYNG